MKAKIPEIKLTLKRVKVNQVYIW